MDAIVYNAFPSSYSQYNHHRMLSQQQSRKIEGRFCLGKGLMRLMGLRLRLMGKPLGLSFFVGIIFEEPPPFNEGSSCAGGLFS